jgi:hypothetical protein
MHVEAGAGEVGKFADCVCSGVFGLAVVSAGYLMDYANAKKTTAGGHTFVAYEETDPLGDKRVKIYSSIWQASSRWYLPSEISAGWKEAESKLPFDFVWLTASDADMTVLLG